MLMMASSEKHSRKHATHFGLELGLGGSIPMGTLIKCSPNCGPSGSLAFVVVAGGAGGAGGGDAVVLQLQPPWRQLSPLCAKWGRQIIKTRPNAVVRLKALHCQMSLNTTPRGPDSAR